MQVSEKLIKPSKIHETLLVAYFWKNPSLYKKYSSRQLGEATFTQDIWWQFYRLGKIMYDQGIRTFDETSVYSFLETQQDRSLIARYLEFGGYNIIEQAIEEVEGDSENIGYHIDEIQKYQILRQYQIDGLLNPDAIMKIKGKEINVLDNLIRMTLEQLKSFFKYKMTKPFTSANSGNIKVKKLIAERQETFEELNKGISLGLPFREAPRLTKITKGAKLGNLTYLVLSSGIGKTSFSMEKYILSLIENEEKAQLYANEEGILRFRNTMYATISANIISNPKNKNKSWYHPEVISRERLMAGKFTQKEWAILNKIDEYLETKDDDIIMFFEIEKYVFDEVIENIETYRPLGYKHILFDTFKPDLSKGEHARWEKFSNHAQALDNCIKEGANNCACIANVQLKIGKEYRYLDLGVIGKALEISEVAGTIMAGRLMFADEYPGGTHELNAYDYKINEFIGEVEKVPYELDPEKTYLILFVPKNRFGGTLEQIVFEVDYDTNSWKEVAYVKVPRSSNVR